VRHRSADGFVILPASFSDGKLSREAWRAVKARLIAVRSAQHPDAFCFRAVRPVGSSWERVRPALDLPACATWVEVWRAIHRVHGVGSLHLGRESDAGLGVAVEPIRRPEIRS